MKIAIAQINCVVGDLDGNAARILDYARRARELGAEILLTPELSLTGYPPEDLLLRDGFYVACDHALYALARQIEGIAVVVGHPHLDDGKRYNAASVLQRRQGRGHLPQAETPESFRIRRSALFFTRQRGVRIRGGRG